jgi:hypothetical protein
MVRRDLARGLFAVVAGAGAGLAVVAVAEEEPVRYTAVAQAAARPVPTATGEPDSSFFQTMGRGGVVESYAEVVRRRVPGVVGGTDPAVTVSIVEETSVLRIEAREPTREAATSRARDVLTDAVRFVSGLDQPYELTVVEPGVLLPGTTGGAGPVRVAAAITGICAALLAYRVLRSLLRDNNQSAPTANSTE